MTRSAAAAALLTVATLATAQARAQDVVCAPPEVVPAHYAEQICNRGANGFVVCRWINRRHDVIAPAECEPRVTVEAAAPNRRSFSGYARKD